MNKKHVMQSLVGREIYFRKWGAVGHVRHGLTPRKLYKIIAHSPESGVARIYADNNETTFLVALTFRCTHTGVAWSLKCLDKDKASEKEKVTWESK